jgi:hypothetical protein
MLSALTSLMFYTILLAGGVLIADVLGTPPEPR